MSIKYNVNNYVKIEYNYSTSNVEGLCYCSQCREFDDIDQVAML